MSRIGDFFGRVAGTPVADDLNSNEGLPGPHVSPDRDQRDTERIFPYGSTGTVNYKGYLVPSEYNADLQRLAALDVYERMRRSDPSVRETLWHLFGPIINAVWTVEPPDDPTDDEREQAAFAHAALFEWMEQPWVEVLEHALTYLTFGHSVFEQVFQTVERPLVVHYPVQNTMDQPGLDSEDAGSEGDPAAAEGEEGEHAGAELPTAVAPEQLLPIPLPPDTESRVLPPRLYTTWRRFSPRLPRTIWRWEADAFGELVKIVQITWVTQPDGSQSYQYVDIPAENLLVFTHEKWGDEWTGISILRSAYKPWVMKEMIEKIAGIAYERHGVGYLVGYIPRERENDQDLKTEIGKMLGQLRADSYAVMPGPKQMSGSSGPQGYLVEILTPPGGIPNFEPILTYWRSEIAGALLVRFKELGHAATGARATADVQAAVWYNALHAIARYIESGFNVKIRQLIDLNYASATRYPKLKAAGIEARNLLEFAQSVALLVDAKMLSPDLNTRQWARATIDAPREDLAETRAQAIFEASNGAQAQDAAGQSATDKLKASSSARGVETDSGENGGRPRVQNAK